MITKFPIFTTLKIEHRREVEKITSRFEPYADFSFVNLFTWCLDKHTEVAMLNGNLVVRLPDYITGKNIMYSLIGDNQLKETVTEILNKCGRICLIPEAVIRQLSCEDGLFSIEEDRDSADYIFDVYSLAALEGAKYKKKRNKVNRFVADFNGAVQAFSTQQIDETIASELRALFKDWAKFHNKTEEEYMAEYMAIDRMLRHVHSLNLLFTIVRVDGKVCAFSVHEIKPAGKAICHFEKALPIHDGFYSFVINFAAKELVNFGVHTVNWQQDLGLPGLRQAKLSYNPKGFLNKYTIVPAQG